jgi:hypothetical protein
MSNRYQSIPFIRSQFGYQLGSGIFANRMKPEHFTVADYSGLPTPDSTWEKSFKETSFG